MIFFTKFLYSVCFYFLIIDKRKVTIKKYLTSKIKNLFYFSILMKKFIDLYPKPAWKNSIYICFTVAFRSLVMQHTGCITYIKQHCSIISIRYFKQLRLIISIQQWNYQWFHHLYKELVLFCWMGTYVFWAFGNEPLGGIAYKFE